jgi:chromosome partitioning protein
MAHVISILNPKGGSGKSTLATNLATYWADRGAAVLLIDTDIQGTSSAWAQSSDIPVSAVAGERQLAKYVDSMRERFGLIVIDGSAKLEDMLIAALKVSDLVVIPVQPSNADIWSAKDLVELVQTRQMITGGTPLAVFVVSRQIQHTALAEGVQAILEDYGLPVLQARTTQRVVYTEALNIGSAVSRVAPGGKAATEIELIATELESILNDE